MKWSTEAKVGAFSLLGIIVFAAIIIELSNVVLFGKSGFHVTGYFKEAEGIEPGNPIHYAGVEVGMVDKISVENGEAVLNLRFYKDAKVPKDADFSIQTSSVMGGRFVKAAGGHQDRGYLSDGMTVQGKAAPGIDQAMDKMDKLINSAQTMLDGINTVVADPASQKNVKNSISNFDAVSQNLAILTSQGIQTANEIEGITSQINSMLYQLNGDGKATSDARQIMDNLVVASQNAKDISSNAKQISGKINGIMTGNHDFDVSVSGELLYNTKKDEFSPNLFLRVGKDRFGILGIESLTNDPVYDALFGRMRGNYGVYAGIMRNKLGGGVSYEENRWKFNADLFNPDDLTMRIRGSYALDDNFFITGQSIFPHSRRGGGEYIGLGYNY
ncbi:MlaD family protein [uncultured Dialister sp.]|uniref:MlaD family protein n=1 Tax=uncultured Dialister sp. TaxID=278064 RepID=UPI0025CDEAE4|nr:MlaD family protein [uncultured Dialister sp.]